MATFAPQNLNLKHFVIKAYQRYFGFKIVDQDKNWVTHICCNRCATNLSMAKQEEEKPFAILMIWRELTDHVIDCYFCMVPPFSKRPSKKKKCTVQYPNSPSDLYFVLHNEDEPVQEAPESFEIESADGRD